MLFLKKLNYTSITRKEISRCWKSDGRYRIDFRLRKKINELIFFPALLLCCFRWISQTRPGVVILADFCLLKLCTDPAFLFRMYVRFACTGADVVLPEFISSLTSSGPFFRVTYPQSIIPPNAGPYAEKLCQNRSPESAPV
jgi:hypothetical protein